MLEPLRLEHQQTRLLIRPSVRFWGVGGRLFGLAFDFGDFVFVRKMILGIKQRAERGWQAVPAL